MPMPRKRFQVPFCAGGSEQLPALREKKVPDTFFFAPLALLTALFDTWDGSPNYSSFAAHTATIPNPSFWNPRYPRNPRFNSMRRCIETI